MHWNNRLSPLIIDYLFKNLFFINHTRIIDSLSVLNRSFEKPSVARAITFPDRCSRRLSAAVVARKPKVKVLCVIQRKVFISCVFKRGVFFPYTLNI